MSDDTVPLPDDGPLGEEAGDELDALLGEYGGGEMGGTSPANAPAGGDFFDGIAEALKNTEPNTPLDEVEAPIDMEHGGIPRIFRGIQKLAGFDAAMAGVDIVLGLVEVVLGAGAREEADPRADSRRDGQMPEAADEAEIVDSFRPDDFM